MKLLILKLFFLTQCKLIFLNKFLPISISKCPANTETLHRIENTRYFIIQNTKQRGEFVTIEQARLARQDCSSHGLKLATVKDMLALAVVGRPLERMVSKEKLKDTWYWLDAKYDGKSERYHWGNDPKDELKYTLILYRTPRPIGVSSHVTYNNVYQKEADKPQCLTLALPWLGSADHNETTTIFYGHQTSFDERDCKSQQKRHAICEANKNDCDTANADPFVLHEDKHEYFETGNWIFGDRKYMVNWKQRTFNESEKYCKSIGLQLMTAGASEKYLIPHIKLWARAITVAQFWTGMSFNEESKQYSDSFGNLLTNISKETNFSETTPLLNAKSTKNSPLFCVALSQAYEFLSQMPCSNPKSQGCTWSFIRYAPANCNNYHGTICQHANFDNRAIVWYSEFKTNLDGVLEKTALTAEFGYKGNNFVLRSKYKQTFGLCYCPKGYRMIRSNNNTNIAWSKKPLNTTGKEIYEYDYLESYWMVDNATYNKEVDSMCQTLHTINNLLVFKEVKCTHWHFYLCEKLGRRPTIPLNAKFNRAEPSKWKEGKQPKIYPLTKDPDPDKCGAFHNNTCLCIERSKLCGYNVVTNHCVPRLTGCPKHWFRRFCQRKGEHIYYTFQGLVCNSQEENFRCNIEKHMLAVNLHGPSVNDSRNIKYLDGRNSFEGWEPSNDSFNSGTSRYDKILGIPVKDEVLYKTVYAGSVRNNGVSIPGEIIRTTCSKIHLTIVGDGLYELSIKTGETFWKGTDGHRTYSFLLNDLYIVRDFQVEKYRARQYGVELVSNFRIFQGGTMMELQGHPSKKIDKKDKNLTFEVCYSFCHSEIKSYKIDQNWIMHAISIIKYAE